MIKNLLTLLAITVLLPACGKKEEAKAHTAPPPALITVTTSKTLKLEIVEETVGTVEGLIDPTIGAEVPGRVVKVLAHAGDFVKKGQLIAELDAVDYGLQKRQAQAEIGRIEALLSNQGKVVDRNQRLVQKSFISRNALDDATSQQDALRQQLEGAKAQLAQVELASSKTRVYSPLDGKVEKQIVSVGDFVKTGDPLLQIIGTQRLRAHLPFPESIAAKLQAGQTVRLTTPTVPDKTVTTQIKELKPLIATGSRAVDAIADLIDQPGWQAGASVNATVILGEKPGAVVVPEASVILRPAGEVVYAVLGDKAMQRIVKTGLRRDGVVEITQGLAENEVIALDGAGFLTDKASIKIQPASQQ